jgi:hypothetical protein
VWNEEAIKDTEYAACFVDGKPTIGWYKGWLKQIEFSTGVLRPLGQTRREWFTPENLATYFEVVRVVMLDVGVDVRKPDYDPEIPYSEEILITHPERIRSYDEDGVRLHEGRCRQTKSLYPGTKRRRGDNCHKVEMLRFSRMWSSR